MDYTDLHPVPECKDGTEAEMLCFALDRVRAQFAWKSGRLDAEQQDRFTARANGREPGPPWDTMDGAATGRWTWNSATTDEPEDLYALWYGAVTRSRIARREMMADGGLDTRVQSGGPDWIVNCQRILRQDCSKPSTRLARSPTLDRTYVLSS